MNLHNVITKLISSKKIHTYIIIVFILGVILLLLPEKNKYKNIIKPESNKSNIKSYTEIENSEEEKLKYILSKVDGVGEIEIIINYSYSKKNNTNTSDIENNDISSYVISGHPNSNSYDYDNPDILGVVVAAQGAENEYIVSLLRTSISEYLCVPLHKISILKLK